MIDEGMKWSEIDIGWKDWWILSDLQTGKLDITKDCIEAQPLEE
jgi:hypothetical protein